MRDAVEDFFGFLCVGLLAFIAIPLLIISVPFALLGWLVLKLFEFSFDQADA